MNKLIILCVLLTWSNFTFSQEEDKKQEEKNSTFKIEISKGKSERIPDSIELKNVKNRFFLVDWGLNRLVRDGSYELPLGPGTSPRDYPENYKLNVLGSRNFNIHIFQQRVNIFKHYVNFKHGFYLDFTRHGFAEPFHMIGQQPEVTLIPDTIAYRRNALKTTSFGVPLMLNFRTNPRRPGRSVNLSAGMYGTVLLSARTIKNAKGIGKIRERDDFNLNKFSYGIRGELGFGGLNFYVSYSLKTLFREGEGIDFHPLKIGLIMVPF